MTASQRLSSRIASPPGSLTWKVSRATPSARVSICAERMLTPWAASVPAMSANSPAVSRVTTTKSEAPRSGKWNTSVTAASSRSRSISRRWAAMRWGDVVRT